MLFIRAIANAMVMKEVFLSTEAQRAFLKLLKTLVTMHIQLFYQQITGSRVLASNIYSSTHSIFHVASQVTDTPGVMSRGDDERNKMELLTLAALDCLPTSVLFVMDLTEECGTSIADQWAIRCGGGGATLLLWWTLGFLIEFFLLMQQLQG